MPPLHGWRNSAACWHDALIPHLVDLIIELMEYLHNMMAGLSQIFIFTDLKFSSMQQCTHLTIWDSRAHLHQRQPCDTIQANEIYVTLIFSGWSFQESSYFLVKRDSLTWCIPFNLYLHLLFLHQLIADVWICKQSSCKQDDESCKWGMAEGNDKKRLVPDGFMELLYLP